MRNLLRYSLLRRCFHDMKGRRPRCFNFSTLYIGNNNCVYIGICDNVIVRTLANISKCSIGLILSKYCIQSISVNIND